MAEVCETNTTLTLKVPVAPSPGPAGTVEL